MAMQTLPATQRSDREEGLDRPALDHGPVTLGDLVEREGRVLRDGDDEPLRVVRVSKGTATVGSADGAMLCLSVELDRATGVPAVVEGPWTMQWQGCM
jgi:hypothetical protein